ncbi:MAG: DUF433 domain-containing protein [Acidobacteria bacterium]|nr:DUF433 domain-containing protein [Acidobacteriota bacterium]
MSERKDIDWAQCSLVETKPGFQSGSPVLRGTRLPISAIINNFAHGVSVAEIAEQFEVPVASVHAIVAHAGSNPNAQSDSGRHTV